MLQSCVVQHHLKPEKLQNRSNEEKGKDKKKEKGEGKEDKKKKENNCCTSHASVVLQSSQLRTVVARRLKEKPGLNKLSNT